MFAMETRPTGPRETRSPLSPLWLGVLVMAALVAWDMVRVWNATNNHDLEVFVLAGRRLLAGEDIYVDAIPFKASLEDGTFSMKDASVSWPYAYPPLIAILFAPAARLPYSTVQAAWWGFNVAALAVGSWLTLRAVGAVTSGSVLLALLLLYRFEPAVVTLRLGQVELAQFLLLTFSLYALGHDWERRAGLALGLATGLKFFPGALIGLLIWRRRWRAVAWSTGTALVAIFGSFAVVGLDSLQTYLRFASIYGIGGPFAAFPFNQSFNGFFSRNLVHNVFNPTLRGLDLPQVAKGLTWACGVAIVVSTAWLTRRRQSGPDEPARENPDQFALQYSLAVAGLLMVSPHSQVHAFVWMLTPLISFSTWLLFRTRAMWWHWCGLAVAYLLLGRSYALYHPGLTRLVQSHYLFGALVLWGILGIALLQIVRQRSSGAPRPEATCRGELGDERL